MSEIKSLSPEEAAQRIEQGAVYVDVRSEPEFEQGHCPGALNVPLMHKGPSGMTPNPEFLDVMRSAFERSEALIVGCRSGGRSRRAAEMLVEAGFENIMDMAAGWEGKKDPFGQLTPGWSKRDLPVESGKPSGQAYADVKQRSRS